MKPEVVTSREEFAATAHEGPAGARVPVEVRVRVPDPFDAYRRARAGDGDGGSYLATTGGQSGWGYFGVDPIETLTVGPEDGNTLSTLAATLASEHLARGSCTVPYPCGCIGWLSYDIARELEDLPDSATRDRDLPRLQLATYDRLAAWEEPRDDGSTTLSITACPVVDDHESVEVAS